MATKATKTSATEAKAVKAVAETKAPVVEAKADAKKTVAKKTTTSTKKTTTKAADVKVTSLIQYAGKEVNANDVLDTIKKIWVEKFQGKVEDIKTVDIYFKPEENKAYFVVNGSSDENYFVEL